MITDLVNQISDEKKKLYLEVEFDKMKEYTNYIFNRLNSLKNEQL